MVDSMSRQQRLSAANCSCRQRVCLAASGPGRLCLDWELGAPGESWHLQHITSITLDLQGEGGFHEMGTRTRAGWAWLISLSVNTVSLGLNVTLENDRGQFEDREYSTKVTHSGSSWSFDSWDIADRWVQAGTGEMWRGREVRHQCLPLEAWAILSDCRLLRSFYEPELARLTG